MSRRIRKISIVSMIARMRTSRWMALFAIGAMLGASVMLVRLSLNEIRYVHADRHRTDNSAAEGGIQTESRAGITEEAEGLQPSAGEANPQQAAKPSTGNGSQTETSNAFDHLVVRIYMTKEKRIERVPLETYVRGVVAGEMPIGFELEALKAQAIAARTYMVRRIVQGNVSGVPVKGADVTDTIEHQVYITLSELATKWPKDEQKKNMSKLSEAVAQTRGKIITYKGEPIEAAFFSTSNGYTENSEDYWKQEIPYLRSVQSPWDKEISPRYKETVELSLNRFYSKLGVAKKGSAKSSIRVVERTEGNRISKIIIGGTTFTGREVREKLGLASSQFTWSVKGNSIAITTYGYGHGVGMSQWGANGMAQSGASAEEILAHYYSSVQVEEASKLSDQPVSRS
ncbi:stage II sporulation protein D [Paenibacillus sp. Soil522]|uniref:stage II sporulation protein D n=1 Tax=Paenibacillus sp. Soil522 TaxID=1736388 RepID=UPI0006F93A1C|nr:stage II sporulation protein D [Paenibacillus sp. Soil522]KRE48600.1 stage II sporulation protein D [Paenibacillus sp. Soil522]